NGSAAPGYSSAQAMKVLEEVFAQTMPPEMGFDYVGMSFQEKKAQEGVSPAAIFGLSLLFVFLILAALYESWSLPFSVLLSTSIAFILGCVPLWTASGAGAVSRRILGTVVIGGMLAATGIAVFLIPVTFYVVEKLATRGKKRGPSPQISSADGAAPLGAPGQD